MIECISLISLNLTRRERRYIFSHKSTRYLINSYEFKHKLRLLNILRPSDE